MSFNPHQWYLLGLMKQMVLRTSLFLSTTSTSATWSPGSVFNTGDILTWKISGDIAPATYNANDPTINLSANTGTVDMEVYDVSNLITFRTEFLNVTEIDISNATLLANIDVSGNSISSLDVSNNLVLQVIDISSNNFTTTINTTNNTILQQLYCNNNQITSLNVSNNTSLTIINCNTNQITSLDVTNNTNLTILQLSNNQISSLDVSNNTAIQTLSCENNQISSLDVSNNIVLRFLFCYGNGMSSTIVDQIFIDLDNNGVTSGFLRIGNNRTSASDTARANLISKGWTIQDTYAP